MLEGAANARHMHYKCNFKFDIYSPGEIIPKALLWCEWRQSWIYGDTPTIDMPSGMPLPGSLAPPNHPLSSPLHKTVPREAAATPQEGDCDIFDDVFGEDVDHPLSEERIETPSF